MLRRLRITEYDFFRNTTAFTHTMNFFKFRRIGTEPSRWRGCPSQHTASVDDPGLRAELEQYVYVRSSSPWRTGDEDFG